MVTVRAASSAAALLAFAAAPGFRSARGAEAVGGRDASVLRGADFALAVLRRADARPLDELSAAIRQAEQDLKDEEEKESYHSSSDSGQGVPIKDEETREIQHEVEHMAHRVKFLKEKDAGASATLTAELDGIEKVLEESAQDSGLREEIVSVRAELCTQQGYMSEEFASCEDFMRKSCIPGDFSQLALPPADVPEGFCLLFFKEEAAAAEQLAAAAPAPGPAAGPAGPAPFKVLFGGKEARPMPEQGLSGDLVPPHKHWDTMVTNWQREYGPGHRSPAQICENHCPNEWCRIHGLCGAKPADRRSPPQTVVVEQASERASADQDPGHQHRSGASHRSSGACMRSLFTALVVAAVASA